MTRWALVFWMLCAGGVHVGAARADLRLAVTTSFENSGLADVVLPAFEAQSGIAVQMLVVGTGQALRFGQAGDVDAILVHAPAREKAFVAQGHAPYRREVMYNDFVLIGPQDDPAGLNEAVDAAQAMEQIAARGALFVSRGDNSGTHGTEKALWAQAGLVVDNFGRWYREAGAGMGATLNVAVGLNAYTLTDRASWLKFGNKGGLAVVFEGDDALVNQYSVLPIHRARQPEAALRFEQFLTSEVGQSLIAGYRVHGIQVFFANAAPR